MLLLAPLTLNVQAACVIHKVHLVCYTIDHHAVGSSPQWHP